MHGVFAVCSADTGYCGKQATDAHSTQHGRSGGGCTNVFTWVAVMCQVTLLSRGFMCMQIIVANPKTAGVARWIFLALWGSKMKKGDAAAIEYITKVRRQLKGS
jgi:hypothetical protein